MEGVKYTEMEIEKLITKVNRKYLLFLLYNI